MGSLCVQSEMLWDFHRNELVTFLLPPDGIDRKDSEEAEEGHGALKAEGGPHDATNFCEDFAEEAGDHLPEERDEDQHPEDHQDGNEVDDDRPRILLHGGIVAGEREGCNGAESHRG